MARKPTPPAPSAPDAQTPRPAPTAAASDKANDKAKPGLHVRNRHRYGYDFAALAAAVPGLSRFLLTTPAGTASIDFSDPAAVKTLNRALLEVDYGVRDWDIPARYLCPPIPGRADVLHHLADLLGDDNQLIKGHIPRGEGVHVLDIGVGANIVYPLLGHAEYGWRFVGVDIDPLALANAKRIIAANAKRIIAANAGLTRAIALRLQADANNILTGLLRSGEKFDLTLCNPPFHASEAEARAAAQRKWQNLGKAGKGAAAPRLNFGGQSNELWYPGGERAFVERLIAQSAGIAKRCLWFTSLVSKGENLRHLEAALAKVHPAEQRLLPMSQGQKQSRIVAWTFMNRAERKRWQEKRWDDADEASSADGGNTPG